MKNPREIGENVANTKQKETHAFVNNIFIIIYTQASKHVFY